MATKMITPCNTGELRLMADAMISDASLHLGHLKGQWKHFYFSNDFSGKKAWDGGRVVLARGLFALGLMGRLRGENGYSREGEAIELDFTVLVFEVNQSVWRALGRDADLEKAENLKRQLLYRLFCSIDVDDNGKISVASKPDINIYSQELSVFGDQHVELQKIQRCLENGGQTELPLATTPVDSESGVIITEPGQELLRIEGTLLALPAYEDVIEGEIVEETEPDSVDEKSGEAKADLPDWLPLEIQLLINDASGRAAFASSRLQTADEIIADIEGLGPNARAFALKMIDNDLGARVCRLFQGQINMNGLVSNEASRILTGDSQGQGLGEWWEEVPALALPHLSDWMDHILTGKPEWVRKPCQVGGWEPRAPKPVEVAPPPVEGTDDEWEASARRPLPAFSGAPDLGMGTVINPVDNAVGVLVGG